MFQLKINFNQLDVCGEETVTSILAVIESCSIKAITGQS